MKDRLDILLASKLLSIFDLSFSVLLYFLYLSSSHLVLNLHGSELVAADTCFLTTTTHSDCCFWTTLRMSY